jgi:hypothetical protein
MIIAEQTKVHLERLDYLLKIKSTGTPGELAQKLNMSESSLYVLLNLAKNWGAKIIYNHYARTYEYAVPMILKIGFFEIDK